MSFAIANQTAYRIFVQGSLQGEKSAVKPPTLPGTVLRALLGGCEAPESPGEGAQPGAGYVLQCGSHLDACAEG